MILRGDQLSQEYIVLISEAQIYPCKKKQKCVNTLGPCQIIENNEIKTTTLTLIKYREGRL